MGFAAPIPSGSTASLLKRVAGAMPRYQDRGSVALAYACGSRAMGLTEDSDLDVTVVWRDVPPAAEPGLLADLVDASPQPVYFDLPGFRLDRVWLAGEQVDVIHRHVSDVENWWSAVTSGAGWQRGM